MVKRSREYKTAEQLMNLVSDVTLDLDAIGEHIGESLPRIRYNRLMVVMESAEQAKEDWEGRHVKW